MQGRMGGGLQGVAEERAGCRADTVSCRCCQPESEGEGSGGAEQGFPLLPVTANPLEQPQTSMLYAVTGEVLREPGGKRIATEGLGAREKGTSHCG